MSYWDNTAATSQIGFVCNKVADACCCYLENTAFI